MQRLESQVHEASAGAHDVRDRVQSPHLVEVHLVDGRAVDGGLHLRQPGENRRGMFRDSGVTARRTQDAEHVTESSMRRRVGHLKDHPTRRQGRPRDVLRAEPDMLGRHRSDG